MVYTIQRLLFLLFMSLALTGCGFHLRGVAGNKAFPFNTINISGSGGVANALNTQIASFHLRTAASTSPSSVTIIIENENITRKALTIDGRGLISEYRVYLDLQYRILYQNAPLVDHANLRLFRDYSYSDSAILGKESEQDILVEEMYRDAANRLLQRTIFLLTSSLQQVKNKPSTLEKD